MILAIDIGNTNIVIGCMEGTAILQKARMATDLLKTSDQYCADLLGILNLLEVDRSKVEGCIVSSVVPPVLNSVKAAVSKLTGAVPLVVGPGIKTGLNILLENPASAGGDLIAGAVAALAQYQPPLLLVDMSTATAITAIDRNGGFLGGCVCPGVKISAEALTRKTAQLPGISLETPKKVIGRNTVDCMRSGLMVGHAAMVDGLLDRMEAELGEPAAVVATGGIARFVMPLCKRKMLYDSDLILKGLGILYENNCKDRK